MMAENAGAPQRTYTFRKPRKLSRIVSMKLTPEEAGMTRTKTISPAGKQRTRRHTVRTPQSVQRSVQGIGGTLIHLGDSVWIREAGPYPFARATLSKITGINCKVTLSNGMVVDKNAAEELYAANGPNETPDDHSNLAHLNEPCVLDSTSKRFAADKIYSYTGRVLIAVNPFRQLDIYGEKAIAAHVGVVDAASLPPHVYSVAERAYSRLQSVGTNQAIVMSGESGAGKTETARHIVHYLASRSGHNASSKSLTEAIVESASITEAFGNAKTIRNDNSSRFGKFMVLSLSSAGIVVSAVMQTYMLERSRVTQLIQGERSYHVFYQLLASESDSIRSCAHLSGLTVSDCRVLALSDCRSIDGVSDASKFESLHGSLNRVGLTPDKIQCVYNSIAAVLHLSNIRFTSVSVDGDDAASQIAIESETALGLSSALLGCKSMSSLLTSRQLSSRRQESILKPLSVQEAQQTRDAIARAIYSRIFVWLEAQLNLSLFGDGTAKAASDDEIQYTAVAKISLLDIFGFERYKTNGFEQLCINYCNEKLQQFFLRTIFKHEQEIAESEGVVWPEIDFLDNEGCVDAIDKVTSVGPGVLRLLESHCKTPQATDPRFFEDVNRCHKASEFFKTVQKVKKRPSEAFIISHFAGDVCYSWERGSWLERENDKLREEVEKALGESDSDFTRTIFAGASVSGRKAQQMQSLSRRFIKDLTLLMGELQVCETHFVRCIKPNDKNQPRSFIPKLVLEQLRASGIFEVVELMKRGYPMRIPYAAIHGKFVTTMPLDLASLSPMKFSETAALSCDVKQGDYALGRTQLFLRAGKGGLLEAAISLDIETGGQVLQQHIRDHEIHKTAMLKLNSTIAVWVIRGRFMRRLRAIRRVQAVFRGVRSRYTTGTIQTTAIAAMQALRPKVQLLPQMPERKARLKLPPPREAAVPRKVSVARSSTSSGPPLSRTSQHSPSAAHAEVARLTSELEAEKAASAAMREDLAALKSEVDLLRNATSAASQTMVADFADAAAQRIMTIEELRSQLKAEQQRVQEEQQRVLLLQDEIEDLRAELQSKEANDETSEKVVLAQIEEADEDRPMSLRDAQLPSWLMEADESIRCSESLRLSEISEGGEGDEILGSMEERFTVNIQRDEYSGTLGVDIDKWQGRVTVAVISPGVPADGKLAVGDEIEGVGGVAYGDITSTIKAIVDSPGIVSLQICRRPSEAVLRAELQMRTSVGKWQYVMVTLLSTRLLTYELPEQAVENGIAIDEEGASHGEINLHDATRIELTEENEQQPKLRIDLKSGDALLLRSATSKDEGVAAAVETMRAWHSQMCRMKSGDGVEHKRGMVWQQGYMELAVGLDEWDTCYFVLDEEVGLRVFASQSDFRSTAAPLQSVPRSAIGKALRSTGQSWYEFGIQIHLVPTTRMIQLGMDDTMIEARATSYNEMLRWLATLNLKGAEWHAGNQAEKHPQNVADTLPAGVPEKPPVEVHASKPTVPIPRGTMHDFTPSSLPAHPPPKTTPGKGGRRYSSLQQTCAMSTPLTTVEILSGWFSVKKEHAIGSKARFCRLLGTNGKTETRLGHFEKVTLVMLHREADLVENGRVLDVKDVEYAKLDEKAPLRLVLSIKGRRQIRMVAGSMRDAKDWMDEILKHVQQLKELASSLKSSSNGSRTWLNADI